MTFEIIVVFAVLLGAIILFVGDKLRHDIVGLLVIAVLGLTHVLKPKELLMGFGNQAIITIAAMFVLSAALMRTGMVAVLGGKLTKMSRGSPTRFMFLALITVCFMSAFINNTPVVVVFIPAVLTVCTRLGESPSKFLMPISFASMLGGSCTLIGTSSNILISSLSEDAGYDPLGMFEFASVGVPIVLAGMFYLLFFSRKFLPDRITIASSMPADQIKEYVTQVRVGHDSKLIGRRVAGTFLANAGVSVMELIRGDRIQKLEKNTILEEADILLIRGELNKILELDREHEISITSELAEHQDGIKRVEMTLFELMVAPESPLIGRTCRQIGLRREFGVSVFALQRKGRHHQRDIADLDLRMGDILLVRGSMDALKNLRDSESFILLEGVQDHVVERHNAPIALAVMLTIVVLAAFSIFPISVLSLGGVAVLVMTKVLSPKEAYRAIDWPVLVLIAGMIALGQAMEQTGAMELIARGMLSAVGQLGPYGTLYIFYALTAILSLLVLNKPAAVLCTPLGILLALKLGVDVKPFIMATVYAASTAMATPMGYQTNLLVYGPGGYNFKDFLKFGLPLNIGVGIIACFLIPIIWDF